MSLRSELIVSQPPARELMMEKHYTVAELAEKWHVSHGYVLTLFEDEPKIRSPRRKQGAMRIAESVVERVYRRMLEAGAA
jgi:hypothetical protein